ncbi:protein NETWORKED 3C isoform X1 [Juglans microcarpa x Juglans regia]|uniref:protein NETWORKED 3C isoform X1 n=2 Tax=Juglans microcarpa x Juglans regia TaxID=2249226 RepID=UPI001B7F4206|nr:protein NETWORKED 3C isoform X1 [Juglans microcarpa x Juglans regia]
MRVRTDKMVEMMMKNQTSHRWWFDSHNSSRRSPWLQSTLAELDGKTTAMLKLIEEDADSFAQRAEMYYKKRPELISMVEEFYRAHRSLAERYDQLKSDSSTRLLTTLGSPFSSTKDRLEKLTSMMDQTDDGYSETCDPEESVESEVDDPELDYETEVDQEIKAEAIPSGVSNDEVKKLREEIERLKEENIIQRDLLVQKDEEKREVIRQLSLAVDVLKDENVKLRKYLARDSPNPKKRAPFEFNIFKGAFLGKLFNGPPKVSVVAL